MAKELLNLGELYVSDFVKEQNGQIKHELKVIWDEHIGAARLEKIVPKEEMYGKYWYHSGTNETMKKQLKDVVDSILPLIKYNEGDIFLDIACNDGSMLGMVPDTFLKVGFDPAEDSFLNESRQKADIVVPNYFSAFFYKMMLREKKAKIITTIAMFYDLEDPISFCKEVYEIMDDEGLWVIQMSYTPLMLKQLAFDNICHEHVYYHSLSSMYNILNQTGFTIVDCTLNDTNGGSFRLFVRKKTADRKNFANQPFRDTALMRCNSLAAYEREMNTEAAWKIFKTKIEDLKKQTVGFIKQVRAEGKTIAGYGASTKGNTLLQYFGLDNTMIDFIVDKNRRKYELKTIGTDIPIELNKYINIKPPDYLLVLPWHFIQEFTEIEKVYLNEGGKFIVPLPKFEIISA